jgi:hypothetical protein
VCAAWPRHDDPIGQEHCRFFRSVRAAIDSPAAHAPTDDSIGDDLIQIKAGRVARYARKLRRDDQHSQLIEIAKRATWKIDCQVDLT